MKKIFNVMLTLAIGMICLWNTPMIANAEESGLEETGESEKIVVALDPGHDARHGGATRVGLLEHELVFKIANYCKQELEKYENIEVYMTRTTNQCPYPLTTSSAKCIRERMYAAQKAGASYYVSFHLNAQDGGTAANGVEVIYPNMGWKPSIGTKGKLLAQSIQDELVALGLKDRGIFYKNSTIGEKYPDGSQSDYYTVQISGKECGIPGVIVENAFISNPGDRENFLMTETGLKKLGVANATAIAKIVGAKIGWVYENNQWYYYEDGVARIGWLLEGSTWYYMNAEGVMQTGWQAVGGTWYYFNASGAMLTGWQLIDGVWYYMNRSGAMLTGWQHLGGQWYYLNETGAMQVGWLLDDGVKYYLHGSGAMATGWQLIDGTWYYMNRSGAVLTGWQYVGGHWYYMDEDGAMQAGWLLDGETWYFLNGSGVMLTGWNYINAAWYYMDGSGAMVTGWQYIGKIWYYMDENGAMVVGEQNIDGQIYTFGNDGAWIE